MCTLRYRPSACSRHGQSVEEYRKNGIEITVYVVLGSAVDLPGPRGLLEGRQSPKAKRYGM